MSKIPITPYIDQYYTHRELGGTDADYCLYHGLPVKAVNKLEKLYQKMIKNQQYKAKSERNRKVKRAL